jgi:hypothetical protein
MDQPSRSVPELPELEISTEKVCQLIDEVRALNGRFPPTGPTADTEADEGLMEALEDDPDDPSLMRMREFFRGLSLEERANLLALLWLGRGDIEIEAWRDGIADATRRLEEHDVAFPFTDEGTAENLMAGLERLQRSWDDL